MRQRNKLKWLLKLHVVQIRSCPWIPHQGNQVQRFELIKVSNLQKFQRNYFPPSNLTQLGSFMKSLSLFSLALISFFLLLVQPFCLCYTQSGWIAMFHQPQKIILGGFPYYTTFLGELYVLLSHFYIGMLPDLEQFGYNVQVSLRTCSQQKQHFAREAQDHLLWTGKRMQNTNRSKTSNQAQLKYTSISFHIFHPTFYYYKGNFFTII